MTAGPFHSFSAELQIIGINPYVSLPPDILENLFEMAGRNKGPLPVCGRVNGLPYRQTLVRYAGAWRLYINTAMLKDSPRRIGEILQLTVGFDADDRTQNIHPQLERALRSHPEARKVFESLPPSRRLEIVRYINNLKTEDARERNVERAIGFLLGRERFIGRDKP